MLFSPYRNPTSYLKMLFLILRRISCSKECQLYSSDDFYFFIFRLKRKTKKMKTRDLILLLNYCHVLNYKIKLLLSCKTCSKFLLSPRNCIYVWMACQSWLYCPKCCGKLSFNSFFPYTVS